MADTDASRTGFSALKAICIGAALLMVGSIWIMVQELLLNAGSLSASSPPVGAVGLFLAILSIALLLQLVKARWGLSRKELLIIYCMLVTFFPLASQGLWHRFVGIMLALRGQEWAYKAPVPEHMLPRGPELIQNGYFAGGLEPWVAVGTVTPGTFVEDGQTFTCAVLSNDEAEQTSEIQQWIPRYDDAGAERFVPGQKFLFLVTVRRTGFVKSSFFSGAVSLDGERWQQDRRMYLGVGSAPWLGYTKSGFDDIINQMFEIPFGAAEGFWLRWRLAGLGQAEISHVSLFSNEPIYRLLEGSNEIEAQYADRVPPDERGRMFSRPTTGPPTRGWLYDLRGYIPWGTWVPPLASWGLLWVAMFAAMFALGAMLFRQWSDREKLTFPLTVFPLLLTDPDPGRDRYVPRLLRSRPLWIGALIAIVVYSLNGLNFYDADFPGLPLVVDLAPLFERAPWSALLADGNPFVLRIVLLGVGIAFFMDLNMAFNLWFFYLVCKLWMLVPYYQGKFASPIWPHGPGYGAGLMHFQGIGAALGIVLIVLWLGRRHWVAVFRKAVVADRSIDDSQEPLPYRWAAALLLVSVVLLGVWGEVSGAGWLFGVLGMGLMLVFAVMAARVRAECAAPGMWLVPAMPVLILMALGGIPRFGMLPMVYYVLAGSFMCVGYFLMLMPALMESFQIAKVAGIGRKTLGTALVAGFLVATISGGYVLLDWGYGRGLSTMRGSLKDETVLWRWRMENFEARVGIERKKELNAKRDGSEALTSTDQEELDQLEALPTVRPAATMMGVGAGITCLLGAARLALLRFPFHPLGYAMAGTQLMSYFWFSILLAWLIRLGGLRLGGVRLIRNQLQPCMIGLIVGSVGAVLIWDVVGIMKIAGGYTGRIYVTW